MPHKTKQNNQPQENDGNSNNNDDTTTINQPERRLCIRDNHRDVRENGHGKHCQRHAWTIQIREVIQQDTIRDPQGGHHDDAEDDFLRQHDVDGMYFDF